MIQKNLEITTRIGCVNMCEYCLQTKLISNYTKNQHNSRLLNEFESNNDTDALEKILLSEYLKGDKNREIVMTMETFELCLSTIPSSVDIHFTGYQEAFENPNALDMMKHAYNKGHRILLNTTLVGMKKEHVAELEKFKFKEINIHMPSALYKENIGKNSKADYIRTGKEISDEYLDLMELMISSDLMTRVDRESDRSLRFHSHGPVHSELRERFGNRIGDRQRGLNSRAGNLGKMQNEVMWKDNWCMRIYHNVLLPDGTVQLCCQDYGLSEPLGNLKHMSYDDLFNTKLFKDKIAKGGAKICQSCDDGVAVPGEWKEKLRSMQNYPNVWR